MGTLLPPAKPRIFGRQKMKPYQGSRSTSWHCRTGLHDIVHTIDSTFVADLIVLILSSKYSI